MTGDPLSPKFSLAAAYGFDSYDGLAEYYQRKFDDQRYGRDSSSIVLEVERALEKRCGGRALLFGSGMSAISAMLDVMVEDRKFYLPNEYYRKLRDLVDARWDTVEYASINEIEPDGPTFIWIESPSNPHVRIADYAHLELLRRKHTDLRIVADLTLAGLSNFTGPFWLFDAEIHSCTKYVGGHNDIMAGLAVVNPTYYAALWERRSYAGGILDPWSAWLLARSLKTYDLRMQRQVNNTLAVVRWLKCHVPARSIFYPEPHDLEGYHHHGGAVVSFRVDCDAPATLTERAARLEVVKMAPSFGSVDSLIEVPATMSHYDKTLDQLTVAGIEPDLVRLSVGIEPVEMILADLKKLLCVTA